MIDVDSLYFDWLVKTRLNDDSPSTRRLAWMLHRNVFQRNVGLDQNRAADGVNLRVIFLNEYHELDLDPRISNDLMALECSWLEMLVALAEALDYIYDGGVLPRFDEMVANMGLAKLLDERISRRDSDRYDDIDQNLVDSATNRVDQNLFTGTGHGGLFPLNKNIHPDQRGVEIWDQQGAYFRERLEGVRW